LKENKVLIHRL